MQTYYEPSSPLPKKLGLVLAVGVVGPFRTGLQSILADLRRERGPLPKQTACGGNVWAVAGKTAGPHHGRSISQRCQRQDSSATDGSFHFQAGGNGLGGTRCARQARHFG